MVVSDFSVVFGDVASNSLLDNSAAKHKIAIKPKKTHSSGHLRRSCSPTGNSAGPNEKYVNYTKSLRRSLNANLFYCK